MEFSAQKLKKFSNSYFSSLNDADMRQHLNVARHLLNERLNTFSSIGDTFYSPAVANLENKLTGVDRKEAVPISNLVDSIKSSTRRDVNTLSRNEAYQELNYIKEFFNAKTSTTSGTRSVQKNQDVLLFGKEKAEEIAKSRKLENKISLQDRKDIWDLYNEYKNQHPEDVASSRKGSTRIQQFIGEEFYGDWEITAENIAKIKEAMEKLVAQQEKVDERASVYSGGRSN